MNSWGVPIAAAASALVVSLPVAMPVSAAEDSRNFAKGVVVSDKPLVISGDVLEVAGRRFRLFVVDAPELFVSLPGLGMYVLSHARSFKHNEAVVGVIMLAAFGLAFEATMNWVMRRYFPWYRRDVGHTG